MKKNMNKDKLEIVSNEKLETSSYKDVYTSYMDDVRGVSGATVLSREEERELFAKIAQGDTEARNELIEKNLKLVVSIAKRFVNLGLDLEDLIQEGNIGLINAVDRFDPTNFDNKFSTYATWWIRQSITRALSQQGNAIHIPVHVVEQTLILLKVKAELEQNTGKTPTYKELADYCNANDFNRKEKNQTTGQRSPLTEEDVKLFLESYNNTVSLESTVTSDEESASLMDVLEAPNSENPEVICEQREFRRNANKAMNNLLDDRSKDILKRRSGWDNGDPLTLEEIGQSYGLTRERVRQIQNKAIKTIVESEYADVLGGECCEV